MERSKSVKLVGFWVSLFTQRVRWALKLKGIEYEYIEEDIFNKTPLVSQLNPVYSKVPILVHNGNPLPESLIMLEYIDEAWKINPLLPQDPYERADARFWARFLDEKIIEAGWIAMHTEGAKQDEAVNSAMESLERIEVKLNGKAFFGGDNIGYLDLVFGFISYMLPAWEEVGSVKILDPLRFPAITAWARNFLDHPIIKCEYLPPKGETISYYQLRRKELFPVYSAYFSKATEKVSG